MTGEMRFGRFKVTRSKTENALLTRGRSCKNYNIVMKQKVIKFKKILSSKFNLIKKLTIFRKKGLPY